MIVELPKPMSFDAMNEIYGLTEIKSLQIGGGDEDRRIDGSAEAFNEFLDFTQERISTNGLQKVNFQSWERSVGTIEPEILYFLLAKTFDIRELYVIKMEYVTLEMRQVLVDFIVGVIETKPHNLQRIDF